MTANPDEYYKNPELLPPGGYAPLAMKGFNRKAPQINVINSEYLECLKYVSNKGPKTTKKTTTKKTTCIN